MTALCLGLALDSLSGALLGQHAIAMLVVVYLSLRFHLRIRVFPIWQMTMTVFVMLAIHEFLLFWIDGVGGAERALHRRWAALFTSAFGVAIGSRDPRSGAPAQSGASLSMNASVPLKDHWKEQKLFLSRLIAAG
ncbi:MAG: hypothetical protein CM1200mP36_05140 [Gammaproteobacteria bacterium]|nr:MAG: hypothetical protein CM1200mP36_05140 [Gammaproteobacteria bacterium]